jgi:hypothetical protein
MSSVFADPCIWAQMGGGGGSCGVSTNEYSIHRNPNKLIQLHILTYSKRILSGKADLQTRPLPVLKLACKLSCRRSHWSSTWLHRTGPAFLHYLDSWIFSCHACAAQRSAYCTSTWSQMFKGTVSRDFRLLVFFIESVSPKPLSIPLGPFRIFSIIRRGIHSSRCTTNVVDTSGKWKKPQS